MRICLMTYSYPPSNAEGIARQRHTLASALALCGHQIEVFTLGQNNRSHFYDDTIVHEVSLNCTQHYSNSFPGIDQAIQQSQILYQALAERHKIAPFDIVDVPLWGALGFVTLHFHDGPVITSLQTTTAQIIAIENRSPIDQEKALIELERQCIIMSNSFIADSDAIINEIEKHYSVDLRKKSEIIYFGVPNLDQIKRHKGESDVVNAIVVGRLEKRKGTQFLYSILPDLLNAHHNLLVNFIGRDNSKNDGWFRKHGCTYVDFFQRQYPNFNDRVRFYGYIDDKALEKYYRDSDVILCPSYFESFGFVYLEAMRYSLPVVCFDIGAAKEIFKNGAEHGGILVGTNDRLGFIEAVSSLVLDPETRVNIGLLGNKRASSVFSTNTMAVKTINSYKKSLEQWKNPKSIKKTNRVNQAMEALDFGDAVSRIACQNANILAELGHHKRVFARWHHPEVKVPVVPIKKILDSSSDGWIFHYWGYNSSAWMLKYINGPKALHYHNITPPKFFEPSSIAYKMAVKGYEQLRRVVNFSDLLVGDSAFNIKSIADILVRSIPSIVLYPIVDKNEIEAREYDKSLLKSLQDMNSIHIIFVGRVVRNKRQDLLMKAFEKYWININRSSHLWLIGSDNADINYRSELEQDRQKLLSSAHIHFTSKIPDDQVMSYYRAASVFICASEHEGFGMPLAEAMALDIPVIALATTAVPETLGDGGMLVNTWNSERIAELINLVVKDEEIRTHVLSRQSNSLHRFSYQSAKYQMSKILMWMNTGDLSNLT